MVYALLELWYTLLDTLQTGDLIGHLWAWWEVVTGQVVVDDEDDALAVPTARPEALSTFEPKGEGCVAISSGS